MIIEQIQNREDWTKKEEREKIEKEVEEQTKEEDKEIEEEDNE